MEQVIDAVQIPATEKPALPPYSGEDATCVKCGNEGASTSFWAVGRCVHDGSRSVVIGVEANERLHRECRRCSHSWDEATVDG